MKSLGKVLNDTIGTVKQTHGITNNMPAHGLTTEGGNRTIPIQDQEKQNQNLQPKPSVLIQNCQERQRQLKMLLHTCYDILDNYGKDISQLQRMGEIFILLLGKYEIEPVKMAFMKYMQNYTIMPKPADIIKILEPKSEPIKFCATTFIDIKRRQREGQFITQAETTYCQDFINSKVNGEDPALEGELRQLKRQENEYWSIQ